MMLQGRVGGARVWGGAPRCHIISPAAGIRGQHHGSCGPSAEAGRPPARCSVAAAGAPRGRPGGGAGWGRRGGAGGGRAACHPASWRPPPRSSAAPTPPLVRRRALHSRTTRGPQHFSYCMRSAWVYSYIQQCLTQPHPSAPHQFSVQRDSTARTHLITALAKAPVQVQVCVEKKAATHVDCAHHTRLLQDQRVWTATGCAADLGRRRGSAGPPVQLHRCVQVLDAAIQPGALPRVRRRLPLLQPERCRLLLTSRCSGR